MLNQIMYFLVIHLSSRLAAVQVSVCFIESIQFSCLQNIFWKDDVNFIYRMFEIRDVLMSLRQQAVE